MSTRRVKIQQMLAREPHDAFLHFGLAMEWLKEANPAEAVASFDRAIAADVKYLAAYYHKGKTLIGLSRVDEARQTLDFGIDMAKRCGDSHAMAEMQELLASAG